MTTPTLSSSNQIGSVEFQIGTTIVRVSAGTLEQANAILDDLWGAIPDVLRIARQESRKEIPEFWKAQDKAGTADQQLAVRGIWINASQGSATYDVGCNYDYCGGATPLPELADDYSVLVERNSEGALEAT
jgi:hypothetical protein